MTDADETFDRVLRPLVPEDVTSFNDMYRGAPPPWDIGRPQPAFAAIAEAGGVAGEVLDVGCGTGEHALMAAALGFRAVGIDAAPLAIEQARQKAADRGLDVTFEVADALELGSLRHQFDTAFDCGLFHVFNDEDRARYLSSLGAAMRPGGRVYVLCFSDRQPGTLGPRRITEAELRDAFADGWDVDAVEPAPLMMTTGDSVDAWLATIRRHESTT